VYSAFDSKASLFSTCSPARAHGGVTQAIFTAAASARFRH
jgi:hypothetical protein